MLGFDFDAILKSLAASEVFDEGELETIKLAGEGIVGWDVDEYMEALGTTRMEAVGVRTLVRDAFNNMGVSRQQDITIPEKPPYLEDPGKVATFQKELGPGETLIEKTRASTGDYDPTDPTQWAKIGDQFYRWDGQRNERYPFGWAHEIVFVEHKLQNGILMPNAKQGEAATTAGQGWFHKGYGCWIRPNGKRSAEISQELLMKVRSVIGSRTRAVA